MCAGGNATLGSLLLAWSRSFSNFQQVSTDAVAAQGSLEAAANAFGTLGHTATHAPALARLSWLQPGFVLGCVLLGLGQVPAAQPCSASSLVQTAFLLLLTRKQAEPSLHLVVQHVSTGHYLMACKWLSRACRLCRWQQCHAGLPMHPTATALNAAYLAGLTRCLALRRANVSVTEQSLLAVQVAQAKQWWGWSTAALDFPCTRQRQQCCIPCRPGNVSGTVQSQRDSH